MPTYTLHNEKTNEHFDVFCKYDEMQQMLESDHNLKLVLPTPQILGHVGSLLSKTDNGWKENLKRIKENSGKGNTIKV